jgi:hypothetical protein
MSAGKIPSKDAATSSGSAATVQCSLTVGQSNDPFEREADAVADQVMRIPLLNIPFSPASNNIQREEKGTTPTVTPPPTAGSVIAGGAAIVLDELEKKPGFPEIEEAATKKLKYTLWDSQPTDFKAGIIAFSAGTVGILGAAMLGVPENRAKTVDALQDLNLALPLRLLPYSEYLGLRSFKYKLPAAKDAPYTFQTEFKLDPYFDLLREKVNIPKVGLSVGIDSSYSQAGGFKPFSGGSVKLTLGGGIVDIRGVFNQPLTPTPMLISNPRDGEAPAWLMRSLPEQNLPVGNAIFITVDVLRLKDLIIPPKRTPKPEVKGRVEIMSDEYEVPRKETKGAVLMATTAPPVVDEVLSKNGKPLEEGPRNFMEERFGKDFSQVRIHLDHNAANSADAIQARAYTSGNDIVFGSGEYQPHTDEGKNLLAHELVHVIQQSGAVQRKGADESAALTASLRTKLQDGQFDEALRQLNEHVKGNNKDKKKWLTDHPDIRFLFLKKQLSSVIAENYSAPYLVQMNQPEIFEIIDCWYQAEEEKQLLFNNNIPIFDRLVSIISPYTGEKIIDIVTKLSGVIDGKTYATDQLNPEFHSIHLLAPTVERKMKFYKDNTPLFNSIIKKFDPFSGISIKTFENLTDTNEVDHKKALQIFSILKNLPVENRRAFLDTAVFAGTLESNKDAEKYYESNFKAQYKALPHNWDSAIMPWNWPSWDAPFAERKTVDHAALMSGALSYEDKSTRDFGFDKGIDQSFDPNKGQKESDSTRLINQLNMPANFDNPQRLGLLLMIAIRGGLQLEVISKVLIPKNALGINPASLKVIESAGFIAANHFAYSSDKAVPDEHDHSAGWYLAKRSLFGGKTSKIFGEQRITVDLPTLQDTSAMMGAIAGIKFGHQKFDGDDYYNTTWLDNQVKNNEGSETLKANLEKSQGADRQGKIFASIRDEVKQANIYASSLAMEGVNYFADGTLYRTGPGVLQGLSIQVSWTKDSDQEDNEISMVLGIENVLISDFQMVAPKSTLAIGRIAMKGMRLALNNSHLHAPKFAFRGAQLTATIMGLLPDVLKLLPYSVMTMTEEFKGSGAHAYKDKLGAIMNKDFYSLKSSLTFTGLEVNNMYDTTAGFLDDFSIEKKDAKGNAVRQGLVVKETSMWTIDAGQHIKDRMRTLDRFIRSEKARIAGSEADIALEKLEAERKTLIDIAATKSLHYEDRQVEMDRLRVISGEMRTLTEELEAQFNISKKSNPLFNQLNFNVWYTEKAGLQKDLDYLDNQYFEDKKLLENGKGGASRFEINRRKADFEARYKSFDVQMVLQGITLRGGNYVQDMLNEQLKSFGFQSPTMEGIENIKIGELDSSFTASGSGVSTLDGKPGIAIHKLQIPLIKAPALAFKTGKMLLEAGSPRLENIFASVVIDFVANPLNKNPDKSYKYKIASLWVGKASFNGMTLKIGEAPPLLDFPAAAPVEVWGLRLWDYDETVGNINVSIRDIKAAGDFAAKNAADKSSQKVGFGIDTTLDNATEAGKQNAIEVNYNKKEQSVLARLNIASAWLPSVDLQSEGLSVTSLEDTTAVELTNIQADVKVLLKKDAEGDEAARPMSIEINKLNVGEIAAQGIKVVMRESYEADDPGKRKGIKKVQEVQLPKDKQVFIKNIDISGLRVTMADEGTTISKIGEGANVQLGETKLGGISYAEKNAKGSLLKAISLHKGNFDALKLNGAMAVNGREYNLKEFFKFFGSTRLEGLDVAGSYGDGKTSASIGIKGVKNKAISVDYHAPKDDKDRGYYDIRLPLSRINMPAFHMVKGEHIIDIPKPMDKDHLSYMKDVDVRLHAYLDFDKNDNAVYDIYLQSLDIADLVIFGLHYQNPAKGTDVLFDNQKALHIPNIRAGGFHFSSARGFDVFGKPGGWVDAAGGEMGIEAGFETIKTKLSDGEFVAEKGADGTAALSIDIEELGFRMDATGKKTITLGKMHGGFPNMTITQTDPATHAQTKTTISSKDKAVTAEGVEIILNNDQSTEVTATGITAGSINLVSTTTLGAEKSTTTVNLNPESIGAATAHVKLNTIEGVKADGTKEYTEGSTEITLTDIKGGEISADLFSDGAKGKSLKKITLPSPDLIAIESIKIVIDKKVDGKQNKHITIQKPTIRNFNLRMPSQAIEGDFINMICDLKVDGNVEMGDGDFDTFTMGAPSNAFILNVPDNVAVEVNNLRLDYKDTSVSPAKAKDEEKPNNAEKDKLIDLEEKLIAAKQKMENTPERKERSTIEPDAANPDYPIAVQELAKAQYDYDIQKAAMIRGAKADAKASMTKKYLDAVQGKIEANLFIFDSSLNLNIETYDGEKYVEISDSLVSTIHTLLDPIIGSTVNAAFWKSEELKLLATKIEDRYITLATPGLAGYLKAIISGSGIGSVLLIIREAVLSKGTYKDDPNVFGLNIDLNSSTAMDLFNLDFYGVAGLAEKQYKHPLKPDFYNLYGIVEYLQYVNPQLVTAAGKIDTARLDRLLKGEQNDKEFDAMSIGDLGKELVAFLVYSFRLELDNIMHAVKRSFKGVGIKADVSLTPEEVLNIFLKDKKAGSLNFDKGKKSIDNLHVEGAYVRNNGLNQGAGSMGTGAKGEGNIIIPGATWLSEDKGTKVSYSSLEISQLLFSYKDDLIKALNKSISMKGLQVGIRNVK